MLVHAAILPFNNITRPVHLGSDLVAGEATKVLTIFVDSVCDDLCFVMWHIFMLEKDKIG